MAINSCEGKNSDVQYTEYVSVISHLLRVGYLVIQVWGIKVNH